MQAGHLGPFDGARAQRWRQRRPPAGAAAGVAALVPPPRRPARFCGNRDAPSGGWDALARQGRRARAPMPRILRRGFKTLAGADLCLVCSSPAPTTGSARSLLFGQQVRGALGAARRLPAARQRPDRLSSPSRRAGPCSAAATVATMQIFVKTLTGEAREGPGRVGGRAPSDRLGLDACPPLAGPRAARGRPGAARRAPSFILGTGGPGARPRSEPRPPRPARSPPTAATAPWSAPNPRMWCRSRRRRPLTHAPPALPLLPRRQDHHPRGGVLGHHRECEGQDSGQGG